MQPHGSSSPCGTSDYSSSLLADGGPAADAIRVLHVDDDAGLRDLTATFLERESEPIVVETAADGEAALAALRDAAVDCVVSDFEMPGMNGLELLAAVRQDSPGLPFVLFTGKGSEEIASRAISAGVTDYLQKGGTEQYEVLANRVENAVRRRRVDAELAETRRRQQRLLDNLPGLAYRATPDPPWAMVFVGGSAEAVTGYPAEAFESGRVTFGADLILEADLGEVERTVERAVERGEGFEVSYRIETAGGERRHVWEQGTPAFEDGALVAIEGIVMDVTAQERRKTELRRWETLGQGALDACATPLFTCDAELAVVHRNDALRDLTGRRGASREPGLAAPDLVTHETRDRFAEALRRAIDAGDEVVAEVALATVGDDDPVAVTATCSAVVSDEVVGAAVHCERREEKAHCERR